MSDLSPLCPKCSKKMFKHSDPASTFVLDGWICPNRYGFTKEMGETVFGILKGGYQKLLAEYIESLGYILV